MSDIIDEMGGYMGDGSEFDEIELSPQIKGKLEYHSTPSPTPQPLHSVDTEIGKILDKFAQWTIENVNHGIYIPLPSPETKQAIQALYHTREITLIREALEHLKQFQYPTGTSTNGKEDFAVSVHYIDAALTNQQKGEQ